MQTYWIFRHKLPGKNDLNHNQAYLWPMAKVQRRKASKKELIFQKAAAMFRKKDLLLLL